MFCCQGCGNGWLSGQLDLQGSFDNCSSSIMWLEDLDARVLVLDLRSQIIARAKATDQEYALRTRTSQQPGKVHIVGLPKVISC